MLYFITDSDVHSVVYLLQNHIYPDKYALETESFKELAPFVTPDDEVIVLVQGFVRWTMVRLTQLIELLEQANIKGYTVYSTIEINIKTKYTKVDGDLVFGTYKDFDGEKWGKSYRANINDRFKMYDKEKVPDCFDSNDEVEKVQVFEDDSVANQLIAVDIRRYKSNKKGY